MASFKKVEEFKDTQFYMKKAENGEYFPLTVCGENQ